MKDKFPFFLYHGTDDQVIPYSAASHAYKTLKELGFQLINFISEESLGHSISPQEAIKVREFLIRTSEDEQKEIR